ncbi:hypothetical protein QL093DRAFT_2506743, partial [Fusarium oxysporum]
MILLLLAGYDIPIVFVKRLIDILFRSKVLIPFYPQQRCRSSRRSAFITITYLIYIIIDPPTFSESGRFAILLAGNPCDNPAFHFHLKEDS